MEQQGFTVQLEGTESCRLSEPWSLFFWKKQVNNSPVQFSTGRKGVLRFNKNTLCPSDVRDSLSLLLWSTARDRPVTSQTKVLHTGCTY